MRTRTGTARSGELDIYYEDMGDPNDPAVLLIMVSARSFSFGARVSARSS